MVRFFNRFRWPFLLFYVSLSLFVIILFPNFFGHLSVFGHWEKLYSIEGKIVAPKNIKPSTKIFIEIGGEKKLVAANDSFKITFPSSTYSRIPVLITINDTSSIKRVTFSNNTTKLDTIFDLSGKK